MKGHAGKAPNRSVEANCFLIVFSLWPVRFASLKCHRNAGSDALELHHPGRLLHQTRQTAADTICLFVVAQARRGAMRTANVRGAVHHLQTRPEPYVTLYPDPRLFLRVQAYYCCSNPFSLMKCLHFHYKKTLLRLSCLDCLLDNWPDHQSKAPGSSALGSVGKAYVHQLWMVALMPHWLHQVG